LTRKIASWEWEILPVLAFKNPYVYVGNWGA
jgi:hypothetical protein